MSKNFNPTMRNATVLPAEMQKDRAANKKSLEAHIASNPEYNRVKRGNRVLEHTLPAEEEYLPNGDSITKRSKTKTTRKSN